DGIRDFHVTGVQTCALPISEYSIKLNIGWWIFLNNMTAKKIDTVIVVRYDTPLICFCYRRKLMHITNKNHLYTAKRFFSPVAYGSEHNINSIKHISTYHTDFINYKHFKLSDNRAPPLVHLYTGDKS